MSECNATIDIGGQTVRCYALADEHPIFDLPVHRGAPDHIEVQWDDEAPGAKPHTPPRYRAYPMYPDGRPCGWLVQVADGWWWREVASFPPRHPDPERAARTEAARLNGGTRDP